MSEIQIKNKSNSLLIGAIAFVIALSVSACTTNTTSDTAPASPEVKASETTNAASYKDGEYTAEGNYISPGGLEKLGVTLTIKNNLITDAKVEQKASLPNSVRFQKVFADNFKDMVVGKNISEVKLDKVSGSSLTSGGFNDAVEKIKSQAKS